MTIDVSFHQKKLRSFDENWRNTSLICGVNNLLTRQVFVLKFDARSNRVKSTRDYAKFFDPPELLMYYKDSEAAAPFLPKKQDSWTYLF